MAKYASQQSGQVLGVVRDQMHIDEDHLVAEKGIFRFLDQQMEALEEGSQAAANWFISEGDLITKGYGHGMLLN